MRNRFTAGVRPGWTRFGGLAAPVADPDPQLEKQALKSQADYLQGELDAIRKRLEEIDSKDGQE